MLRLVVFPVCLCAVLMLAIWGAHLAGKSQPVSQNIRELHLHDCLPPCWIGIIPGVTTIKEAKEKLVAAYRRQTIKDAGFADGPVLTNVVENTIEGADFTLYVRLNTTELVDGQSETVQSIELSETRNELTGDALTVGDILGAFGRPQQLMVDDLITGGYEITMQYTGWFVVFASRTRWLERSQNPRLYLGHESTLAEQKP